MAQKTKLQPGIITECVWIDNNPQYYRNPEHQTLVKNNIRLRYRAQIMLNKLNAVLRDTNEQRN